MHMNKGAKWSIQPFKGSELKIGTNGAPNWFHRMMQKALLGFIWKRHKGN